MDDAGRIEFERAYRENIERAQLDAARAKLNSDQLARLDDHAAQLREREIYQVKHETALATILRTADDLRQRTDIKAVYDRAEREAQENDLKQQAAADVKAAQDAQRQKEEAERAKDAPPQPTPEAVNAQQHEAEETRKQQIHDSAQALGQQGQGAAAAWVAQAETVDRQRHQHGRYDFSGSSPPSGAGGTPPRDPSPTPPTNGPLSPNDVLQRFGNPALQARYQDDNQRREQQIKSASPTPATPSSAAARGNVPGERTVEEDFRAAFSAAAIRKRAEEAAATKANDPTQSMSRGGRSR